MACARGGVPRVGQTGGPREGRGRDGLAHEARGGRRCKRGREGLFRTYVYIMYILGSTPGLGAAVCGAGVVVLGGGPELLFLWRGDTSSTRCRRARLYSCVNLGGNCACRKQALGAARARVAAGNDLIYGWGAVVCWASNEPEEAPQRIIAPAIESG